jgi:APA family basic amino acid/polyamine antiporter
VSNLFRTKSIEQSLRDTQDPEHRLKKNLGAMDLIVFGVGVCVGGGIFVLTGQVAASHAGPSVALAFVIAAIGCGLAGLCYAELASTVPVAGSAYTFAYASVGEFVAWIIGWDLILEFTLASSALATSFSDYLAIVLDGTPYAIPDAIQNTDKGVINLPAGLLVLCLTAVLVTGIKLSSRISQVITFIKIAGVLLVVIAGCFFIKVSNWSPFIPPSEGAQGGVDSVMHAPLVQTLMGIEPSSFGIGGLFSAAALVFFAFIGFDVVATTAEETKNPQKNLPIGIFGSLAVVTVLYVAVSLVITGMQNYKDIDLADGAPLATAFKAVDVDWMANVISIIAVIGLVVVSMTMFLGQTRIAFAMARDGLFPQWLAKTHPKFRTPYRITIVTGIIIAVIAAIVPLSTLVEMINIGTLFAFMIVSVAVIVLRRKRPDVPRAFKVPLVPWIPALAVIVCGYLALSLPMDTWIRFVVWLAIGVVIYFAYSQRHSRLGRGYADEADHEEVVAAEAAHKAAGAAGTGSGADVTDAGDTGEK